MTRATFSLRKNMVLALCMTFFFSLSVQAEQGPITLRTMGSLFFGGTVTKAENGETFHGDHGYWRPPRFRWKNSEN